MITLYTCGGVGKNHQLIAYISAKEDCPMCQLIKKNDEFITLLKNVSYSLEAEPKIKSNNLSGETCKDCGTIIIRTGACSTCPECGRSGSCG